MRLTKTARPFGAVKETAMRSRSPAGPRRLGTATRISASLFRRLSAFFGSAPNQGPKAAKFAVLTPGRAGFPNRAKRSEGSDSAPTRNAPVSPCEPLCARLGGQVSFICKTGSDIFGHQSQQLFEEEGIDTSYIFSDPKNPSGVALITVDAHAENCIVVASGANANLLPSDLAKSEEAIEKAEKEFDIYRHREMNLFESDFDRAIKILKGKDE